LAGRPVGTRPSLACDGSDEWVSRDVGRAEASDADVDDSFSAELQLLAVRRSPLPSEREDGAPPVVSPKV
jgi:hypothetical protein